MPITRLRFERFTAFERLDVEFSTGINMLIGANGTGKTHLMKVAYAACEASRTGVSFADKLIDTFLPSGRALGRMTKRQRGSSRAVAEVFQPAGKLRISFSNHTTVSSSATVTGAREWRRDPVESTFIPAKDILSNAPGFQSLYGQKQIHFDETYRDILLRAYTPMQRGPIPTERKGLLAEIGKTLEGKITFDESGEFFHESPRGKIEFSLLAEGMCKLGLLWVLIQNGSLQKGSVLFWDEPEANLNPALFRPVMEILLQLQRSGVQVFLATHDYVILKQLDLWKQPEDQVRFLSLFRDGPSKDIRCATTEDYLAIDPNAIADTFDDLYDHGVRRSLGLDAR